MNPQDPVPGSQFVDYRQNRSNPVPQMPLPPTPVVHPPRSHTWWKRIIVIIVVLAVLAGIAYAGVVVLLPSDKLISSAIDRAYGKAQSRLSIDVRADVTDPKLAPVNLHVVTDTDKTTGKTNSSSVLSANYSTYKADLEVRYIDRTLYFKVNSLPSVYAAGLSQFVGQWYYISYDDLAKYARIYNSGLASTSATFKGGEAYQYLRDKGIFTQPVLRGISNIGGRPALTYGITIDKEAIVSAYVDEIMKKNPPQNGTDRAKTLSSITDAVRQQLTVVDFSPVIVSVSLLDRSNMAVHSDIKVQHSGYVMVSGIHSDISVSNMLADATVEKPTGAKDLQQIIEQSLAASSQKGTDARTKADLSQLRAVAEIYFSDNGSTYSGVCSSAQAKQLLSDIKTQVGEAAICRVNSKAYVFIGRLKSDSTGNYYCVDSIGQTSTSVTLPTGYVCK